jgi:hypothetical protein
LSPGGNPAAGLSGRAEQSDSLCDNPDRVWPDSFLARHEHRTLSEGAHNMTASPLIRAGRCPVQDGLQKPAGARFVYPGKAKRASAAQVVGACSLWPPHMRAPNFLAGRNFTGLARMHQRPRRNRANEDRIDVIMGAICSSNLDCGQWAARDQLSLAAEIEKALQAAEADPASEGGC